MAGLYTRGGLANAPKTIVKEEGGSKKMYRVKLSSPRSPKSLWDAEEWAAQRPVKVYNDKEIADYIAAHQPPARAG